MLGNVTNSLLEAKMQRQESLNSILGSNIIKNKSNGYGAQNQDLLIDSTDISKTAVDMYQRELDIKNFTKLATSDQENTSHNDLVEKLFAKGVVDVFEDNIIASLSQNKSLLQDLNL